MAAPPCPDDAPLIFRAALDALARPGTVHRLEPREGLPAALLPLLALADLTTPACVLAESGEWAGVVRVMTSAPITGLAGARLVAALRPLADGELGSLRTGSPAVPEDGALACLAVTGIGDDVPDGRVLRLSGPGVPGSRELRVAGLPPGFAASRSRLVAGFPAGADLLFVTPGGVMAGLPRTTRINEERINEERTSWAIRG